MTRRDLVIIGAGPAGMAAAAKAAELGLSVTVLDEQRRAGGQIYRDVDKVAQARGAILGKDYTYGTSLTAGLRQDAIEHVSGAIVWAIEDGFRISFTKDGRGAQVAANRVLLATGALERPMPVPGWTLPGVMTAGAGQILLKQSGVLARRAVLVGSGPLLYLIAAQMVRAGTPPVAMVETQTRADLLRAMRHFGGALRGWRYLLKGLGMLAEIMRAGVPRHTGATEIAIEGAGRFEAVSFKSRANAIASPARRSICTMAWCPTRRPRDRLGHVMCGTKRRPVSCRLSTNGGKAMCPGFSSPATGPGSAVPMWPRLPAG